MNTCSELGIVVDYPVILNESIGPLSGMNRTAIVISVVVFGSQADSADTYNYG